MSERNLAQERINRQIAENMGDVAAALCNELSDLPFSDRAKDTLLNIMTGNTLLVKGSTITVLARISRPAEA